MWPAPLCSSIIWMFTYKDLAIHVIHNSGILTSIGWKESKIPRGHVNHMTSVGRQNAETKLHNYSASIIATFSHFLFVCT